MEDKIEVGEYVRTKRGKIKKIISIKREFVVCGHGMEDLEYICQFDKFGNGDVILADTFEEIQIKIKENIVNHNKNIIKLIEIGDYINGYLIVAKRKDVIMGREKLTTEHTDYNWQGDGTLLEFYNEDIKSIVTKEQFEFMKYEVK